MITASGGVRPIGYFRHLQYFEDGRHRLGSKPGYGVGTQRYLGLMHYARLIRTDFAKALWDNPEAAQRVTEQTPLRRFGEADDFKGIAVFVASDASAYVTGQALTVCGGTHMFR